jgi:hypothetical protein
MNRQFPGRDSHPLVICAFVAHPYIVVRHFCLQARYRQAGCNFPINFLSNQNANFDIFALIKICLDFNNFKVLNKVKLLLPWNYPY